MADPWRPLQTVLTARPPALPLHLPAHGRGRGLAPGLARLLRRSAAGWDLPELPEIGGPLEAEGAVAEAQHQAAALFGAERCWFGVNGASGLLQAALLALAPPGACVLLPRNLHRSLLHACVLGDLRPLLFAPPFDPRSGLWLPPEVAALERLLAKAMAGPEPPQAAVLVDPTYQGLAADLPALVATLHRHGLPVLVDQAHGTGAAVAAGADLTVLSLQKSGSGLAQSAVLLAQGRRVDPVALERSLLWLQTSSPSALLLASSAAAVAEAFSRGGLARRRRTTARARRLRQRLVEQGLEPLVNTDPLRLVLPTAPLGFTGLAADAWLLERGVIAELPEPGALTFCLGLAPPPLLERRLPRALERLRRALGGPPLAAFSPPPLPALAAPELAPGQAWRAAAEVLSLERCAGRLAAEPLCPYPPGIPLLVPGERIDAARLAWLQEQSRLWPGQIPAELRVIR
ncbi:MAG: lysine decarboxylase [Synechococcaceae cyanobacterium]|nr:lysine decarboxylase [Synechococcaceae cyanobacterium]